MLPSASALASRREERVQKAFSVDHHGPGDARLSQSAAGIYGESGDYVLTWPLFFSLGRGLTACASALGAHFRLRQLGRGRGALWRLGGRHLHLVGRGVRVRVRARADGVGVLAAAASRRAPMPRHAFKYVDTVYV